MLKKAILISGGEVNGNFKIFDKMSRYTRKMV
jgi:hypothetical protein